MKTKPFVSVYIIAWNEETIIEFVIKHHMKMFPNCIITLCDNQSTDRTVDIAKSYGCKIHSFDTNNEFDDDVHANIKNTIWKTATTDWIWISDCDELGGITQDELKKEEALGNYLIEFKGWNMVNNTSDDIDLEGMKYGFHHPGYSKWYLFNKQYIAEMNTLAGAHRNGDVLIRAHGNKKPRFGSSKVYDAYHYKLISRKYTHDRQAEYLKRSSNNEYIQKLPADDPVWYEQYDEPLTKIK